MVHGKSLEHELEKWKRVFVIASEAKQSSFRLLRGRCWIASSLRFSQ
jgi:hypothetical protein